MKNWLTSLILFSAISLNAQEVTDYEYVIFPESFSDFSRNEYNLKSRLNQYLKDKNYKPLSAFKENWPQEIQENPCLALKADVKKVKSFLNNKLNVTFSNCHQQVILTAGGTSKIKDFNEGYQDALSIASQFIPTSNPNKTAILAAKTNANISKINREEVIAQLKETTPTNTVTEKIYVDAKVPATAPAVEITEITANQYTDGKITVEKVELKNGGFILMNPETAQIIAKFQPSSKANIFRVTVTENNYNTIGYTKANTISYEIADGNQVKEIIFKAK